MHTLRKTTITAVTAVALATVVPFPATAEVVGVDAPDTSAAAAPKAGQCFRLTNRQKNTGVFPNKPKSVDCAVAHDFEIAKVYRVPKKIAKYGFGSMAVNSWSHTKCVVTHVPSYLGRKVPTLDFVPVLMFPSAKKWRSGDQNVFCGGATFDMNGRPQRSTESAKDLPEYRDVCWRPAGGMSQCIPGAIRWQRAVQIYRNAWNDEYPGKAELLKAIEAKVAVYVPQGTDFYYTPPVKKRAWNRGEGRFAMLALPV